MPIRAQIEKMRTHDEKIRREISSILLGLPLHALPPEATTISASVLPKGASLLRGPAFGPVLDGLLVCSLGGALVMSCTTDHSTPSLTPRGG